LSPHWGLPFVKEQFSPAETPVLLPRQLNCSVQLVMGQACPDGHTQSGQQVEPAPHCHGAWLQGVAPAGAELHAGASSAPTAVHTASACRAQDLNQFPLVW
jgi:hypothetical protein